ncbi:MAG: precorrin-2 C(20)-methyltransferase, partial [Desulfonatronovibrionaceae bacterium]
AVYPMRRDQKATSAFWRQMAEEAALRAEKGCVVAQITLGDPLLFSTSCYFLTEVQTLMSRGKVHVVPGIAAFQAVSARLKKALAVQEDRLLLMTGTETEQIKRALQECETLVLYKAGQNMQHIRRLLEEEGLLADSALVCYAEQKKEFVCRDLREYSGCLPGYLACVVIHVRRREWQKD